MLYAYPLVLGIYSSQQRKVGRVLGFELLGCILIRNSTKGEEGGSDQEMILISRSLVIFLCSRVSEMK